MSEALVHLLDGTAHACRAADPPPTAGECEQMLRSLNTVTYEVAGLAERIRAAQKVNGTDPPHPVKPVKPPPPPPPPTKPAK